MNRYNLKKITAYLFSWLYSCVLFAQTAETTHKIVEAKTINSSTVELILSHNRHLLIDFYGENIFRLLVDSSNHSFKKPVADPPAEILVSNPRKPVSEVVLKDKDNTISVLSQKIHILFDKNTGAFSITNLQTGNVVATSYRPFNIEKTKATLYLKEQPSEYFYGGGVQNGRFSHKGKVIAIENQNNWTDGGVASPTPFYWSTKGYAAMWYTFKKGKYDFGAKEKECVALSHNTNYIDLFFIVNDTPVGLLNDFYQLTGNPVLLPKFAFYEGHLNAYNRDYWKEDNTGILFENGKKYKESQNNNGGIKESLNGELKDNYPFSARAVIDRYKRYDMPLGWILPNDGYGAGYGQTRTLDSNVLNLKNFGDYTRKNGVQIGLWTQSDLHPKEGISALLQRDIVKEVKDAGVRVLKTDVAWVGAGYSFGLNGVADVAKITSKYGNNARPFIISLDGWAGTQRYASIWTGDQSGGQWEYIRFHIPTYIGSGLSGQPNITSDMDGIFGGKNTPVNVRDFQWKTFTPMQLNMDGWGSDPKYPSALGEPATSINRNYLKLKSQLLPYAYSIAHTAINGMPIIRPIFMEEANAFTWGTATQYQYLFGPYFLVAPVYQNTKSDKQGNDIRNGIYLPKGNWIDYFTGEQYEGNRVINSFDAPLWKLPLFVKPGAIIPMVNANNNISEINRAIRIYEVYPSGSSSFTEYDDDGTTENYKNEQGVNTTIRTIAQFKNQATIIIEPAKGHFDGMVTRKTTIVKVNVSAMPKSVTVTLGNKKIRLANVNSLKTFNAQSNVVYYDAQPNLNAFATPSSEFAKTVITKNPQLLIKMAETDITKNKIEINVQGFVFQIRNTFQKTTGSLVPPVATITDANSAAFTLMPTWNKTANTDFYEIRFNDMLYSYIRDTAFVIDVTPETHYRLQLRAANQSGYSNWVTINGKTKMNPLQFAIKNITGYCTAPSQSEEGVATLFDFDETNSWHTQYGKNALPFDLVLDLKSINQLDKLQYLPRSIGTNGIVAKGKMYYSLDKKNWALAGDIDWAKNNEVKQFLFTTHPSAQYIKLSISEGVGQFGSGREIYVFKVPGSPIYTPGDINNDGIIDKNDLTSYTNYTGLRKEDGDFDGYISNGDVNRNNLIDAFDISNVTTQLDGGATIVTDSSAATLSGQLLLSSNEKIYKKDEVVEIVVKGDNLNAVNALSFALPYLQQDYEYIGVQPIHMLQMENLTYDRLHTNGSKALYPTFVNIGDQPTLSGNQDLFIIKLKAKREVKFELKAIDGLLVDKELNQIKF